MKKQTALKSLALIGFLSGCAPSSEITVEEVQKDELVPLSSTKLLKDTRIVGTALSGTDLQMMKARFYLLYPPKQTVYTSEKYGYDSVVEHFDANNDGLVDFLYMGNTDPTNVVGYTDDDTDGMGYCGGEKCVGDLVTPTLYVQNDNGRFLKRDDLLVHSQKYEGLTNGIPVLADFNSDGIDDFYIYNSGEWSDPSRDAYYLSQPDGTWVESSYSHMSHPEFAVFNHQIDVGDIDNDGDIDIVMAAPTRMVCLINKGDGTLKKRDYCARQVTAFGVELADMDGDGDLDIVAAAHEYGNLPNDTFTVGMDNISASGGYMDTAVFYNSGSGYFNRKQRLERLVELGTVPEVESADFDGDGDNDILLSRAGPLYVGTALEIKENLGDRTFGSKVIHLIKAPEGFSTKTEANEWNAYCELPRVGDFDFDGDIDITCYGGGGGSSGDKRVHGVFVRNDGGMNFTVIPSGDPKNPIGRLTKGSFY